MLTEHLINDKNNIGRYRYTSEMLKGKYEFLSLKLSESTYSL